MIQQNLCSTPMGSWFLQWINRQQMFDPDGVEHRPYSQHSPLGKPLNAWFISIPILFLPRVETLKPEVKTRGWDKQPIFIPPQLLVMIRITLVYGPHRGLTFVTISSRENQWPHRGQTILYRNGLSFLIDQVNSKIPLRQTIKCLIHFDSNPFSTSGWNPKTPCWTLGLG